MTPSPVTGGFTGDVCFDEVKDIASYISPVPGGVGPMTRAMLLRNVLKLAKKHMGLSQEESTRRITHIAANRRADEGRR